MKGFEVYIVELIDSVDICVARNIHKRSRQDIEKVRIIITQYGSTVYIGMAIGCPALYQEISVFRSG